MIKTNLHTRTALSKYFDFEVSLLEIKPRIWRRLRVIGEAASMKLPEDFAIRGGKGLSRLIGVGHLDTMAG